MTDVVKKIIFDIHGYNGGIIIIIIIISKQTEKCFSCVLVFLSLLCSEYLTVQRGLLWSSRENLEI